MNMPLLKSSLTDHDLSPNKTVWHEINKAAQFIVKQPVHTTPELKESIQEILNNF